jgi:hypothetical protein
VYDTAHNSHPAEHLNGTHGVYAPESETRFQAWKTEPRWTDREPPYLHSLKYAIDGIEHLTVIRASDVDDLWKRVRTVMELVRVTRERKPAPPVEPSQLAAPAEAPEADKGYCAVHNIWMTRHTKGEAAWYSHKHEGTWCRGQERGVS